MRAVTPRLIAEVRKSRGLTLAQAASSLKTRASTFYKWERGERQPRRDAAKRLADWIGLVETDAPQLGLASVPSNVAQRPLAIEILVGTRMAGVAAELGLDLTTLFATVGTDAVRAELKRRLAEIDAEAHQAQNAYFAEHGLPLAKYRSW